MIDKIWHDWQEKSPKNKYSYGGGTISPIPSFTNYTKFPTGLPPFLNVSASSDLERTYIIIVSDTLFSPPSLVARSLVTDYGTLEFRM